MKQKELLTRVDTKAVFEAITEVERHSAGEIRVHIQPRAYGTDVRSVAERTFERLGMTKTASRNGVLLFIASEDQKFVILGDRGFNEKVDPAFWDAIAEELSEQFRAGEFTAGIIEAIRRVGVVMRTHFPFLQGDANELSNDISVSHDEDSGHHVP